jgi:histone-lysine N-methyltransferase EZH2
MKTCWEVFQYMNCSESKLSCQVGDGANSLVEGYSKVDLNGTGTVLYCACPYLA